MGLFTDNPVLERELRGRLRLRRKGTGRGTSWLAWAVGLIALYFYTRGLAGIGRGTMQDAQELWGLLANGALALVVLLAPAVTSTAITQEREQQTWEALAATQLSAAEVLLGKWLGRQMILWLLLALLLPFLAACALRGRLGLALVPGVLGFFLVTTGLFSALGLLCSFQARRTVTATASALTLTAVICVGTPVIDWVIQLLIGSALHTDQATQVMWANPFYVLSALAHWLTSGTLGGPGLSLCPDAVGSYFLFALIAIVAALAFMVSRYRHAVRERS